MARIHPEDQEPTPVPNAVQLALNEVVVSSSPIIITGVNRKINIGNYESIDIYAAVALPTSFQFDEGDMEAFTGLLESVAEYGFRVTSQEANKRYQLIKELQSGKKDEGGN